MEKLRLFRKLDLEHHWFINWEGNDYPVTVVVGDVGWGIAQTAQEEYLDFKLFSYNVNYLVSSRFGMLMSVEIVEDPTNLYSLENKGVDELFISPRHPAAGFFKKTRTNEDGSKTTVQIYATFDKQPY